MIPGFGLLGTEFEEPDIHHYELDGDRCLFADGIVIPYDPFCGVMGVAPDETAASILGRRAATPATSTSAT